MTIQANLSTAARRGTDTGIGTATAGGGEILETARRQVLEDGIGLDQAQLEEVLRLPDEALPAALELAHQVRLRHCG
jgi:biotin synthase